MSSPFQSEAAAARVVLVVEDEPVLRTSIVRGLSKLPAVDVADAGTVRDAKELIRSLEADLVISDLDLPDGSGIELLAELDRCNKRVPVIFVSAYVRKYAQELPRRPDVDIHEKPVSLERLRNLVETRLLGQTAPASPFSVADYVQLAGMCRRSVVLQVRRAGKVDGAILMRSGEVWSAHDREGAGVDAFRRLAFAKEVTVECRALTEELGPRTLEGSAESILLDAARVCDEAKMKEERVPLVLDPEVDQGWESSAPPPRSSGTRERAAPRELPSSVDLEDRLFREHYERGVEALLGRNHAAAYEAFLLASHVRPTDTSTQANLNRLREMGFGGAA